MKLLKFLYSLPILPITLVYQFYVTNKIMEEKQDLDLHSDDAQEKLWDEIQPHLVDMYKTYKYPFHAICIMVWLTILRFIW